MRISFSRYRWWWVAFACVLAGTGGFTWLWYETAPLRAARVAVATQDWQEGYRRSREYLRDRPAHPEATLLLAKSLSAMGRVEEAEPLFDQVAPLSLADLEWRAYALIRRGQWTQAAVQCQKILELAPDHAFALQQLAALWAHGERAGDALELAARLARQSEHATAGHALQALIHDRLKQWQHAVGHWQKVLELDPAGEALPAGFSMASVRSYLADDLLRLGRIAEAQAQWEQVRQMEPTGAKEWMILGAAAERMGDFDAARQYWRRSLELEPGQCDLKIRLGTLELELGRVPESLTILLAAAQECAPSTALHHALASAYAAQGQADQSRRHRDLAEQLRPQEERKRQLTHVLMASPDSVQAKLIGAAQAFEAGDFATAEVQVLAVVQQYPDREDARELLERVRARLAEETVRQIVTGQR